MKIKINLTHGELALLYAELFDAVYHHNVRLTQPHAVGKARKKMLAYRDKMRRLHTKLGKKLGHAPLPKKDYR